MKSLLILLLFICPLTFQGQEDLLSEIEQEIEDPVVSVPAFKAMKICNLQSTKVAGKGDLYMYVSHRFGTIQNGINTFFGLDDANTKIQMVYGLFEGVQLGLARESLGRTFSGSLKLKIMKQSGKYPVNISAYMTSNYNTALKESRFPELKDSDRYSYASLLLISKAIDHKFSIELAPGHVRHNVVFDSAQKHDQFVLGTGARYKLTKRTSVNSEYTYNFSRSENSPFSNQLSLGIDIETGGHVFQLLFTNAQSTNEPSFLSKAEGDWSSGDIFFGFNIVRVF